MAATRGCPGRFCRSLQSSTSTAGRSTSISAPVLAKGAINRSRGRGAKAERPWAVLLSRPHRGGHLLFSHRKRLAELAAREAAGESFWTTQFDAKARGRLAHAAMDAGGSLAPDMYY